MYTLADIIEGNYPISQTFGANPAYYGQFYIYGVKMLGHEAVDFATPVGIKCLAPFAGKVLRAGYQPDFSNYGITVCIWDPIQKCAVWFCHLSEWHVDVGQNVTKGQDIGKTGNTGNSIGPHLHFGIVETDANANRLHPYDGYGGFINPIGPKVKWVLGSGTTTPPVDPYVAKFDQLKISIDRLQSETATLNAQADKKAAYTATMVKVKKISDTGSL